MSRAKVRKDLERFDRFKVAFDDFMQVGKMATELRTPETARRFAEVRERLIAARAALD